MRVSAASHRLLTPRIERYRRWMTASVMDSILRDGPGAVVRRIGEATERRRMAKGTEQAPETTTNSRAQASPPQTIGSGRDIGDRARLALVILATLILIMTFGHWALTVIGFLSSEAGRYDFSSYYAAALARRENLHANIYSAVTMA